MSVAVAEKSKKEERKERLLRLLTYEVVDGKPIYYKGYKRALELMLSGEQPEESMGASFWHSDLLASLIWFLKNELGSSYRVTGGELGYWVERGKTWRNLDIAVFRYEDVKDRLESDEYIDVPPVLVVEIDVRADVESEMEYVWEKSEQLLNSGVEKVVWIFTRPRKVFVFEKGKRPTIYDWDEEVELLEDVKVRLSDLLK